MILKALYDYYHALGSLPAPGTELKEIHYTIVISKDGKFKRFESNRIDKKRVKQFVVPKGVTRTAAPKSNLLWDNAKYVFAFDNKYAKCKELFVAEIDNLGKYFPDDESVKALQLFYSRTTDELYADLSSDPLFNELKDDLSSNFSFRIDGDTELIAEKKHLLKAKAGESQCEGPQGICLITGDKGPIVRLTTGTPIPNSSPNAAIVGLQVNSGYDSYGKTQAYNAPISPEAEFAYSAALKYLLDKNSKNKIRLGDRIFLFWGSSTDSASTDCETAVFDFFNFEYDKTSNPNAEVEKIRSLFKSIWSGEIKTTLNDRFYFLGIAPNVGRIAVVSWNDSTLKDFAHNILRHFDDMKIIDNRKAESQKPYFGIFSILSQCTLGGKVSDVKPNLPEALLKSIITNTPYPFDLYTATLERIRAELSEKTVTIGRAAILKAYLNRKFENYTNIKPIQPMLDKTFDNQGYLCGRLAAVLEKVQDDAKSGDSIRTRYLNAASATPAAVFPSMLNLTTHHSEKLNEGSRIFYEQIKQEILSKLPASGFPAHLGLHDQGRFFVGYYHQRADFYTKKQDNNE